MSAIWLGEQVSWQRWAAVCVGLIGILVIIRPGFGAAHWALVLPLATAILFAAFQVLARIVGRTDSSLPPLLYSNAVALLRSEEHTSEPQSLTRTSYAVLCSKNNPH